MELFYMSLSLNEKEEIIPSRKKRGSLAANDEKRKRRRIADGSSISLTTLVEFLIKSISDIEMKSETKQRLPSFISYPNGVVLHVLKRQ